MPTQAVLLAGIVDLLRQVKNLSLRMQTVNTLPWENEEYIVLQMALLGTLATDLDSGKIDRLLSVDVGREEPAFEMLLMHMEGFKRLKLYRFDVDGTTVLNQCDLVLPSAMRSSRIFSGATAPATDADGAIMHAFSELALLARKMKVELSERLRPPPQHATKLKHMGSCFDLREMASSSFELLRPGRSVEMADAEADAESGKEREAAASVYVAAALRPVIAIGNMAPLEMVTRWLASRDAALAAPSEDIPTYSIVKAEYQVLCQRLLVANGERPFSERWRGASGTVIMHDVLTDPRFYTGCHRVLHLFAHCAMKTMNEAVVEGMGGVWDRAASSGRHLSFDESVAEAVVAWSAPQPYHAEAVPFINESLEHLFGSEWAKRFQHQDGARVDRLNPWSHAGGLVVKRLKKDKRRLPSGLFG